MREAGASAGAIIGVGAGGGVDVCATAMDAAPKAPAANIKRHMDLIRSTCIRLSSATELKVFQET
jgi:hypothetical protein